MQVLGLDVGGTTIKSGLVDASGRLTELKRTPTPFDPSGKELVETLASLVGTYQSLVPNLLAVGLSVPGIVDSENGVAVFSGTLGWRDIPLTRMLESKVDTKVFLVHDVTAGGLAELRVGAAKGLDSAIVIAIGTGLAASIITRGEIYRPHSAVGELGHVPTRNLRPCVCGRRGCLEMTCSGGALSRNFEAATGDKVPAHVIIERAESGDRVAKEFWDEFLEELGFSCHYIAGLLGPEAIIIAGGFGYLGEKITGPLSKYLDSALTIQKKPRIICSVLEGTSGCIGSGLFALERLVR
jgi:glucokinase